MIQGGDLRIWVTDEGSATANHRSDGARIAELDYVRWHGAPAFPRLPVRADWAGIRAGAVRSLLVPLFCDVASLVALAATCRAWRDSLRSDAVWRALLKRDFPADVLSTSSLSSSTNASRAPTLSTAVRCFDAASFRALRLAGAEWTGTALLVVPPTLYGTYVRLHLRHACRQTAETLGHHGLRFSDLLELCCLRHRQQACRVDALPGDVNIRWARCFRLVSADDWCAHESIVAAYARAQGWLALLWALAFALAVLAATCKADTALAEATLGEARVSSSACVGLPWVVVALPLCLALLVQAISVAGSHLVARCNGTRMYYLCERVASLVPMSISLLALGAAAAVDAGSRWGLFAVLLLATVAYCVAAQYLPIAWRRLGRCGVNPPEDCFRSLGCISASVGAGLLLARAAGRAQVPWSVGLAFALFAVWFWANAADWRAHRLWRAEAYLALVLTCVALLLLGLAVDAPVPLVSIWYTGGLAALSCALFGLAAARRDPAVPESLLDVWRERYKLDEYLVVEHARAVRLAPRGHILVGDRPLDSKQRRQRTEELARLQRPLPIVVRPLLVGVPTP